MQRRANKGRAKAVLLPPAHFSVSPEAAVRGVWQAQSEDLDVVNVDQLEKVLPQLVRGVQVGQPSTPEWCLCDHLEHTSLP